MIILVAIIIHVFANSINNATLAVNIADNSLHGTATAHDQKFFPNVKQFARIWRAYLISEFTDCFGPYAIEGFRWAESCI